MKWRKEFRETIYNRRGKNALACLGWATMSVVALFKTAFALVNFAEANGELIVMDHSIPNPGLSEKFAEKE